MSNFTCVEPNAIEQQEKIWLTGIKFNTCVVPKLQTVQNRIFYEKRGSVMWFSCSYLPKIKTNGTNIIIFIECNICFILRVIYFWMNPFSFVVGIVNLLRFPFSLKLITRNVMQEKMALDQ